MAEVHGATFSTTVTQRHYVTFEVYSAVKARGSLSPPDYLDKAQRSDFIRTAERALNLRHAVVGRDRVVRLTKEGELALEAARNKLKFMRQAGAKNRSGLNVRQYRHS